MCAIGYSAEGLTLRCPWDTFCGCSRVPAEGTERSPQDYVGGRVPRRPQHWFPGLIGGQGVVRPSGAACTLDHAEVYPFGLTAQISVRFRGPLALDVQRELSQQSASYLWNKPSVGPQLTLEQEESGASPAEVVTHEGHHSFWTTIFLVRPRDHRTAISMTFDGPSRVLSALLWLSVKASAQHWKRPQNYGARTPKDTSPNERHALWFVLKYSGEERNPEQDARATARRRSYICC